MLTNSLVQVLEKSYTGWDCPSCGRAPLPEAKQVERDETCLYACLKCDREVEPIRKVSRLIDLTEPIVVMQSVKVSEQMLNDGDIPF